jgi:hypothetical protein
VDEVIDLSSIFDKNLNFLIGSGASAGLFPTLALRIRDANGADCTVETLATSIPKADPRFTALFMHYYLECIRPAQQLSRASVQGSPEKEQVLANYRVFIETVLQVLARRRPLEKKCNVFTTNYDPCFALVADELLQTGTVDFVVNDGARGFTQRHLQARNFNTYLCQTGIFERDQTSVPQLNLIHLHGSVYWRKNGAGISVDYSTPQSPSLVSEGLAARLADFSGQLANADITVNELAQPELEADEVAEFHTLYDGLPIVNPTKWKFHETVFEEHYYQMLRLLSYELEKPNAVLITYGFSFADEHVLNLIKRSLANPKLQVFVCCYSAREVASLRPHFDIYPNVRLVGLTDTPLTFTEFNKRVFSLRPAERPEPQAE